MTPCFNKINALVAESFPEEWYKKFHFDEAEIPNFEDTYLAFTNELNISKESFFSLLNISILAGEYISVNEFDSIVKATKDALGNIPQPLPGDNIPLQERLQIDLNRNYIQCLKVALNMYIDFTVWVQVKIKLSNIDYIHQSNEELNDAIENEEFDDFSFKQLVFLQANISIARHDHYQTPDVSDYKLLVAYSSELVKVNKLGGNKFSLLLKEKTDFLLCKWILRKKDINRFPVHHIKDSIAQELNINELNNSAFSKWIDIIQSHYQFSTNWKEFIYGEFNDLKNRNLKDLSILELHRLIKYYKDVSKNLSRLTAIRTVIQLKYEDAKQVGKLYDVFVYSVLVNYAINNELSLIEEEKNYDEIIAFYTKVNDIQSETGIKNFFPQNKVVGYLIKNLKKKFDDKTALTDISAIRTMISKSREIIKSYRVNVTWSQRNYNYVFHLPFEECLIDVGNSDIQKIFIASSFVLPLDKTKYVNDFDKFEKDLENMDNSLSMMENVESELKALNIMKKEVVAVKQDLLAKDMKSMETIAIFTTIVTFVLASVSNFKFIETAYQAALFTLCLAISLGFFVFLLIIIRQGDIADKIRKYFWNLFLLTIFGIFLWLLLIFSNEIKMLIKKDSKPKVTTNKGSSGYFNQSPFKIVPDSLMK